MQISQRAQGTIFKFCVVIREANLQKNGTNLRPGDFFLVFSLLGHSVHLRDKSTGSSLLGGQLVIEQEHLVGEWAAQDPAILLLH